MAKKSSQIKNVLIRTKTEGSKEALSELNAIDNAMESLEKNNAKVIGQSRTLAKAFSTATQGASGLSKIVQQLQTAGKAMNKAFSGDVAQTKKIDSYATNLEFLVSVMTDFNSVTMVTANNLSKLNNNFSNSPFGNLASDVNLLVGLMQELVEGMDELNIGSRISNARMKQVREYIADVGQAADLTTEQIDDLTRGFMKNTTAAEAQSKSSTKVNQGLRGIQGQAKGTTKGFSDLVFGTNPLVNAYAALAVNIYAASEAFRILNEAASFDRLQEQIASFSAGVSGVNVRDLASDLQEASGHALTFKEAINLSTQGTAFNFTSAQMQKLTVLTRKASVALGRDFSDSMERVTKGIAKQEVEVLDEIGVVTRLETAFGKYAATVGKSVDKLTEYERQVALTNEVMGQLEKKYNGIDAQATVWENLSANIRNVTQVGLSFTQKFLTPAVGYFNTILEQATRIPNAIRNITVALEDQKKTFDIASKAGNYAQAITSAGGLSNKLKELKVQESLLAAEIKGKNKELEESNIFFRSLDKNLTALQSQSFALQGLVGYLTPDSQARDIAKDEKELAIVREALAKGTKEYEAQVRILAEKANVELKDITESTGQSIKSFSENLENAKRNVGAMAAENVKAYGSFSELVTQVDKMVIGSENLTLTAEASKKAFADVAETFNLDSSIDSFDKLKSVLKNTASISDDLGHTMNVMNAYSTGSAEEREKIMLHEIESLKIIAKSYDSLGTAVSNKDRKELNNSIELKTIQLERLRIAEEMRKNVEEIEHGQALTILSLQAQGALESEKLATQQYFLELKIDEMQKAGEETKELERQLAIMKAKEGYAKMAEKRAAAQKTLDFETAENSANAGRDSQSERVQVDYAEIALDIRRDEIALMDEGIEKQYQLNLLKLEEEAIANRKNAAPARDAQSAFGQLQGLNGLSDLQSGSLEIGETLSKAFADASEAGKEGFSGMVEHLSANSEAFTEMSMGLANAAGDMFQSISDSRVAALDMEIAAEQKRDGKSAESLAKIKKLEAEKIKEQSKAAKAQVIMSTSVAIMRAFQDMGIWGAIPAALMAAQGAMQISQINSAANGQLAALNSSGSDGMSITGGTRDNRVDVSAGAQSGEAAYFGGSSNTLPGRAGGGRADAGDALVLGETGAEIFVPDVPGTVMPAGRSSGSGPTIGSMPISINAIDSQSFEDRIDAISAKIYENVDMELRARRNTSLDNLG